MGHTYTNILIHAVFSTKDRQPFMADLDVRSRIYTYMGGIIRELGGHALGIGGPADHIHVMLAAPATQSLADLMRILKTNSSRWIHEQRMKPAFAWQTGYGAFSVSESNRDQVLAYIARQEEHHRSVSFQDEFIAFLKRHAIDYDERYVWD